MKLCSIIALYFVSFVAAQSDQWINPPPLPASGSNDPVASYLIGSVLELRFNVEYPLIALVMFERGNSSFERLRGLPLVFDGTTGQLFNSTEPIAWTVATDLYTDSSAHFTKIFELAAYNQSTDSAIVSSFFNITNDASLISSSQISSSPTSTTAISSLPSSKTVSTTSHETSAASSLLAFVSTGAAALPTSSSSNPSNSSPSELSTNTKIGLGVGVGLGAPLLIALGVTIGLLMRRRSFQANNAATGSDGPGIASAPNHDESSHTTNMMGELESPKSMTELETHPAPQLAHELYSSRGR